MASIGPKRGGCKNYRQSTAAHTPCSCINKDSHIEYASSCRKPCVANNQALDRLLVMRQISFQGSMPSNAPPRAPPLLALAPSATGGDRPDTRDPAPSQANASALGRTPFDAPTRPRCCRYMLSRDACVRAALGRPWRPAMNRCNVRDNLKTCEFLSKKVQKARIWARVWSIDVVQGAQVQIVHGSCYSRRRSFWVQRHLASRANDMTNVSIIWKDRNAKHSAPD